MHCFYACSNQKATTNSYLRVKKSDSKLFDLTIPYIPTAIPAHPFLDETFHAKRRGISSSLSLFYYFRHLYSIYFFKIRIHIHKNVFVCYNGCQMFAKRNLLTYKMSVPSMST